MTGRYGSLKKETSEKLLFILRASVSESRSKRDFIFSTGSKNKIWHLLRGFKKGILISRVCFSGSIF
jgi:hypothetical protein